MSWWQEFFYYTGIIWWCLVGFGVAIKMVASILDS